MPFAPCAGETRACRSIHAFDLRNGVENGDRSSRHVRVDKTTRDRDRGRARSSTAAWRATTCRRTPGLPAGRGTGGADEYATVEDLKAVFAVHAFAAFDYLHGR